MINKIEVIRKLDTIKKNQKPVATKTISYKGERKVFDAYDIDLNLLRFNPLNDRIHTDIKDLEIYKIMDNPYSKIIQAKEFKFEIKNEYIVELN